MSRKFRALFGAFLLFGASAVAILKQKSLISLHPVLAVLLLFVMIVGIAFVGSAIEKEQLK